MIKDIYTLRQIPEETSEKVIGQETFANEAKVLPVCYRCAQVPKNGLYDGFRVEGMFFCSDCQQELFAAEQDSPEYQEYLFLVKGLLFVRAR
jgi:Inhibitor of sigma-G Gin